MGECGFAQSLSHPEEPRNRSASPLPTLVVMTVVVVVTVAVVVIVVLLAVLHHQLHQVPAVDVRNGTVACLVAVCVLHRGGMVQVVMQWAL